MLAAACGKEEPLPHTVGEFIDNPILLEATIVRCNQDRARLKYEAECINAREAANKLAAVEKEARRKQLEAQSERKRKALRRAQEAAAAARRQREEAERRREEAEYLGVFETPEGAMIGVSPAGAPTGPKKLLDGEVSLPTQPQSMNEASPPPAPENRIDAPVVESETVASEPPRSTDLQSIRDELKRRGESQN